MLLTYADDLLWLLLHPVGSQFVSHSGVFIWLTLMHLITSHCLVIKSGCWRSDLTPNHQNYRMQYKVGWHVMLLCEWGHNCACIILWNSYWAVHSFYWSPHSFYNCEWAECVFMFHKWIPSALPARQADRWNPESQRQYPATLKMFTVISSLFVSF